MHTLTTLLSTPLADLRAYWLEERCCDEPTLSPLWFHAARWPGWLLSDLALDHTCQQCGAMPALTLLSQDRSGLPLRAHGSTSLTVSMSTARADAQPSYRRS